ncbi:MAG: HIT family protein [Oscillospiraceae bacterium]|nr:HIT family protein [Clostridia bacterium]MBP0990613.1 HIT family protein [Oscillospiraceae bacterium]
MCVICDRIEMIKSGANRYFVRELETGYVVIGDHQHFFGYTLFLCKEHKTELHYLDRNFKVKYLEEMSIVQEAVAKAFGADKMNVELLGNGDAHVHFHIFPRRKDDILKYRPDGLPGPVWWTPIEVMNDPANMPSLEKLEEMKRLLGEEIDRLL